MGPTMRLAFTLIELLVVIAIIGVLAAILFPVFARAKAAANDAVTRSNLKQLGTATALYLADSDDVLPPSTEGTDGENREGGWILYTTFGIGGAGRFDVTRGVLYPYTKSKGVFISPNDPDGRTSGLSFAFNGCLLMPPFQRGLNPSVSVSTVEQPASRMYLTEEGTGDSRDGRGTNDGFYHPYFDRLATWHAAGTAILFLDTHVAIRRVQGPMFEEIVQGGPEPCWEP